jgi:hypothetical protein
MTPWGCRAWRGVITWRQIWLLQPDWNPKNAEVLCQILAFLVPPFKGLQLSNGVQVLSVIVQIEATLARGVKGHLGPEVWE